VLYWNGASWQATNVGTNFVYSSASLNLTNISATLGSAGVSLAVGNYLTTAALSGDTSKYVQAWELAANSSGTQSSLQGTKMYFAGGNMITVQGTNNTIQISLNSASLLGTGAAASFVYTSVSSKFVQEWELEGASTSGATSGTHGSRQYWQGSQELYLSGTSDTIVAFVNTRAFVMASEKTNFVQGWELTGGTAPGCTTSSAQGNTWYFSGDNRVVLSGTSNTIAISVKDSDLFLAANSTLLAPAAVSSRVIGIAGSNASTASGNIQFATGNNVTFGLSGNTITASASFSQSVQPGVNSLNGSTGQITLLGASNVSVSNNGSSVSIYGPASLLYGMTLGGNSATTGSSQIANSGFMLAGGGNITLSQSNNTISIYAPSQSVQPAQTGISGIVASDATYTSGTVIFSNQANVTIGTSLNGASQYVRLSVAAQTAEPRVISLNGMSQSITLSGASNVSVSSNGSTIYAYGPASLMYGMTLSGNSTTAGSSQIVNSGFALAGGNNITLSQNNNSITVIGATQSVQPAVQQLNGSSGTMSLAAGTHISISSNNSTMTVYGPSELMYGLTIGGNSSTNGSSQIVNSGFLLAGGNNIMLRQSNNTISIVGVASHAEQTGVSGIVASNTTFTSGTVLFSNLGNVTISQSVNGASQYVQLSVAAQTAEPRVISLNGMSQSLTLSGASNVSVSTNGSTLYAYGPASLLYGMSVGGNSSTEGSSQIANSGFVLAGGTNITLHQSNGTISVEGPSSQIWALTLGGNSATAGSSQIANSGFLLAGGNNITLSQNNNTISIVGPAPAGAQTGISGIVASDATYTSGTVLFSNQGNITIGSSVNGASQYVRLSVAAQSDQPRVISLNGMSQSLTLSGASNISVSTNGSTLYAYGPASLLWGFTLGGNYSSTNSSQMANTGFQFAGGPNITIQQNNNSIAVSGHAVQTGISGIAGSAASTVAAGTVQFANGNNISFGLNASTMTASYMQWLSSYEVIQPLGATGALGLTTSNSGPMLLYGFELPHGVLADHCGVVVSMNYDGTGQSSYRQSGTLAWGLYTRPTAANSTQLDTIQSSSFTYGVTFNSGTLTVSYPATTGIGANDYTYLLTSSAGLNLTSLFTGVKLLWLNMKTSLTPGHYWIGLHHRNISSSNNYGIRMSLHGPAQTLTGLLPFGLAAIQSTGTNLYAHWGGNWNPFGAASYTNAGTGSYVVSRVSISQITADLTVFPYLRFASRITA
jgi:hypothetical protein